MYPIFLPDLLVSVERISLTIDVPFVILLFSTQGVDFNSSLKFSFDLSLPGKKTSRKTPSSRKVKIIHEIWVSFIHWKTETALKIDCTLDSKMLSLFSFFFFLLKKTKQTQTLLYPCGLAGLVQHLSCIVDWFSNIQIPICCVLFPELIPYITEVCIRKYPHPQRVPLWKLFSGLCTDELCHQYFPILCGTVISGDIWLPILHHSLPRFTAQGFCQGSTFHPSPEFPGWHQGWAPPAALPVLPLSLADRSHARLPGEAKFPAIFHLRQWWQLRYPQGVSSHPFTHLKWWFISGQSLPHPCVPAPWPRSVFCAFTSWLLMRSHHVLGSLNCTAHPWGSL